MLSLLTTMPAVLPVLLAAEAGDQLQATTDALSQAIVGTVIVLTFVLLVMEKAHRVLVIFAAVALMLGITYLSPFHLITFSAAKDALDLNVLFLLAGMMAIVGVLKMTGVFPWMVTRLLERAGGKPWLIQLLLIWFTGIVSALADNVTTVIFLTPMAVDIARRTRVNPMAYLLPMVMAANVGGAATLIGDPPNILIGSGAGLLFMDFIVNLAMPILWMMLFTEWMSRRFYAADLASATGEPPHLEREPVIREPLLLRWSVWVGLLVFVGFATHGITHMPVAVPALVGAAVLLVVQDILYLRTHRPAHSERVHGLLHVIESEIEWPTLSFFAFLFIAVGAAVETGLIDTLAGGLAGLIATVRDAGGLSPSATLLFAAILICWASGIFSALIDNIPFVAVAIPIVARLIGELPGDATVLWWALALGACLGGNGSPIGASANVTVIGLAEKEQIRITFAQFMRFGVPVTVMTLIASSVYLAAWIYAGAGPTTLAGVIGFAVVMGFRLIRNRRTLSPTT